MAPSAQQAEHLRVHSFLARSPYNMPVGQPSQTRDERNSNQPGAQTQYDGMIEDQFQDTERERNGGIPNIGNPFPQDTLLHIRVPNDDQDREVEHDEQPLHERELLIPSPTTKARSAKATPWITLRTVKQLGVYESLILWYN